MTLFAQSRYPKRLVRAEKSSIFNFEYINKVWISGELGVNTYGQQSTCFAMVTLDNQNSNSCFGTVQEPTLDYQINKQHEMIAQGRRSSKT